MKHRIAFSMHDGLVFVALNQYNRQFGNSCGDISLSCFFNDAWFFTNKLVDTNRFSVHTYAQMNKQFKHCFYNRYMPANAWFLSRKNMRKRTGVKENPYRYDFPSGWDPKKPSPEPDSSNFGLLPGDSTVETRATASGFFFQRATAPMWCDFFKTSNFGKRKNSEHPPFGDVFFWWQWLPIVFFLFYFDLTEDTVCSLSDSNWQDAPKKTWHPIIFWQMLMSCWFRPGACGWKRLARVSDGVLPGMALVVETVVSRNWLYHPSRLDPKSIDHIWFHRAYFPRLASLKAKLAAAEQTLEQHNMWQVSKVILTPTSDSNNFTR